MNLLDGANWQVLSTAPGVADGPDDLPRDGDWLPAPVPGTAAAALREAGRRWTDAELDGRDWWWRTTVDTRKGVRQWVLVAEGLATLADVWVGGEHVLSSTNMFRSSTIALSRLPDDCEVVLRCAATLPHVASRRPRPRWKSTLVEQQGWRWLRTSLLGRAASWSGSVPPVGPWRPVALRPVDRPIVLGHRIRTTVDGQDGLVRLELRVAAPAPVQQALVRVGSTTATATMAGDHVRAEVRVPGVRRWWPHAYGQPERYPVEVDMDGSVTRLPDVGFRTVTVDRDAGAFALHVNGVPVFARGACWMPMDPVSLQSDPAELRATLEAARDAGFTMIRIPGGTVYECDLFYELCDEIGLLVWQDVMLATLDPPQDPQFTADLAAEVEQLADRIAGRPSLAVLCGGSETEQQPTMLGLRGDRAAVPAITDVIPDVLTSAGVDVPYVTSSPSGGALPTDLATGVSHYFGVSGYRRPLSDVRSARVRFAAECLAFSIPPERGAVDRWFGSARVAGHHPAWKEGVPRDRLASWDFEDVRDHYVAEIFGVDPRAERWNDPERYLDLGRAAVCIAMEEVFAEWRRPGSGCSGGLVWTMRDLRPGAGWGLMDYAGDPKAPWYVLKRALAPCSLLVRDDGLDGISVAVINDGPLTLEADLEITIWSEWGVPLETGRQTVTVPTHSGIELRLDVVLGTFTDAGYVYRFGPRARDALQLVLRAADGTILAEKVALLGNHLRPVRADGMSAVVHREAGVWAVDVSAHVVAQWVVVACDGYRVSDSWFHLVPGMTRRIWLDPVSPNMDPPTVRVRALNIMETTARRKEE